MLQIDSKSYTTTKWLNKIKHLFITPYKPNFVKKISMKYSDISSLWYIKRYSLSSTRGFEHSITNNSQKASNRTVSEAKINENKKTNNIFKKFSNATFGLNILLTKQPNKDFLKKRHYLKEASKIFQFFLIISHFLSLSLYFIVLI